jgi:hypothetical protein
MKLAYYTSEGFVSNLTQLNTHTLSLQWLMFKTVCSNIPKFNVYLIMADVIFGMLILNPIYVVRTSSIYVLYLFALKCK